MPLLAICEAIPIFKQSAHKRMHIKIVPVLIDKLSKDRF